MPGYLKASLNVEQARLLLVKFKPIPVKDLISDEVAHRFNRVNATLLYVSQPAKKNVFAKGVRNFNSTRKVEVEKYHRFVVFGIPGGSTVLAMFTANSEESRRLLRYHDYLKPGSQVAISKPAVEGQLSKGGTAPITTNEPLIPLLEYCKLLTLPPFDVEGTNLMFQYFSFVTKRLRVDSAVVAEQCCPGHICDGQTYHDICGCLETLTEKTWVLRLEFKCPELNEYVSCEDLHKITSSQSTNVFVAGNVRALNPDSDRLDHFDLDECVQNVVESVNRKQGFRIFGWFKPAQDEDGTAVENKRFHICCLMPETDLETDQLEHKYMLPSANTSNAAPTATAATSFNTNTAQTDTASTAGVSNTVEKTD